MANKLDSERLARPGDESVLKYNPVDFAEFFVYVINDRF
jgi:hypothetical protein